MPFLLPLPGAGPSFSPKRPAPEDRIKLGRRFFAREGKYLRAAEEAGAAAEVEEIKRRLTSLR